MEQYTETINNRMFSINATSSPSVHDIVTLVFSIASPSKRLCSSYKDVLLNVIFIAPLAAVIKERLSAGTAKVLRPTPVSEALELVFFKDSLLNKKNFFIVLNYAQIYEQIKKGPKPLSFVV